MMMKGQREWCNGIKRVYSVGKKRIRERGEAEI